MKLILKGTLIIIVSVIMAVLALVLTCTVINSYVRNDGKNLTACVLGTTSDLPDEEAASKIRELDPECAVILGAGIADPETPSPMLKDRLDAGILLYKQGLVKKLLLTGDNGQKQHNEIHVMLKYCVNAGVPTEAIFCDHAGFSTYDSMYRAKSIYKVKRAVVVTQSYHLYRALYIAKRRGIKVLGVASDQRPHDGQETRDLREFLARIKDFLKVIKNPPSTYGGDPIPISGDSGESSHGEDL